MILSSILDYRQKIIQSNVTEDVKQNAIRNTQNVHAAYPGEYQHMKSLMM